MKRRKFLQFGALGSTALTLPLAVFSQFGHKISDRNMPAAGIDLEEITAATLQEGMQTGKYTARSITEAYLARIDAMNQQGPSLRAVIEVNPEALSIADQLDEERKAGKVRGPLHGIPVMIKDNIDTADQMQTTAGSLALVGSKVKQDAFIVEQLRKAGVVLLGKTNLSEWANFRSTRSSSGWSGRGGQTRNPYVLDRNPCGSSSGSGVAVSASLCTIAIGTETNGSIVCPSSANGIVGIKPTVGLVSRSGIIPISHSQDTAGPMARTVTDAALLLGALTGTDPRDAITKESEGKRYDDYMQFLDKSDRRSDGLKGMKIGVGRNFFGFHEKVDQLMEDAISTMKAQGATFIDLETVIPENELDDASFDVLQYEFKAGLNQYLFGLGADAPVKTLKDVIAFNKAHRQEEMPYFEQEILVMSEEKGGLDAPEYKKALETVRRVSRTDGIDKMIREHQLDAIIAPTGGPAWPTDLITGDHFLGGSSSPAAMAGYPNITVPAGDVHGLPVGISFFAGAYAEPVLLKIAYAYEQATQHRRTPQYLERAEL